MIPRPPWLPYVRPLDSGTERRRNVLRPGAGLTGTVTGVFVKICAMVDPDDAVAAVNAGADAVGVIFAPSGRRVEVAQAREIVDAVRSAEQPALVVGVFRDHLAHEIIEIAEQVGLDGAQLHGQETPATSRQVHAQVPILIRGFAAGDPKLADIDAYEPDVVLLDAPTPGGGVPFDWGLVGDVGQRHRLLLAGGLRPENVAEAIAQVRPWGVDVASGVEIAPGRKDHEAMASFVEAARTAGRSQPSEHPPLSRQGYPA